jgi:hypothetical protein
LSNARAWFFSPFNAIESFAEAMGSSATGTAPASADAKRKNQMNQIIEGLHYVAVFFGAAMLMKALHLSLENRRLVADLNPSRRLVFAVLAAFAAPSLAHAQTVDLRTATESGNAIIMYLSGTFAAVGIVAAGVAMMMGRQSIAKWAFAGALVSGLAFAIVRTMWSNMGLEAAGVSTFAP